MTPTMWYSYALQDASRRRIPELEPLITMLHQATVVLRQANWTMPPSAKATDEESHEPA